MSAARAQKVYIVSAKRTAFGTFGGKLKDFTANDLGVSAAKAAIAAAKIDAENIDASIWGNVAQTSTDAAYMSRHIALRNGMRKDTTALNVNRLCGSGFQSIITGMHELSFGDIPSGVALVGGSESMSQAPLSTFGQNIRFGHRLGTDTPLVDTLWAALTDQYAKLPMGVTAENVASQYGITREMSDKFALRSQKLWAEANAKGAFNDEIAPIEIKGKKGVEQFTKDEHPRPESTLESMAKLPTVFKKDGVVSAGSASGICDGAAALIIATEEAVNKYGLTPLARVVDYSIAGVDPTVMGLGPIPAIRRILSRQNKTIDQIDLVEVNEAFGAQALGVQMELKIDDEQFNTCGGAIALGHPLGASGARIMSHLVHKLQRENKSTAIGSACIGGGQGIAILIEKV